MEAPFFTPRVIERGRYSTLHFLDEGVHRLLRSFFVNGGVDDGGSVLLFLKEGLDDRGRRS